MRGPKGCNGFGVEVMQVQRVQNDLLYRRYFFERAETARRLDGNANEKTRNLVEARRFSRCRLSVAWETR